MLELAATILDMGHCRISGTAAAAAAPLSALWKAEPYENPHIHKQNRADQCLVCDVPYTTSGVID